MNEKGICYQVSINSFSGNENVDDMKNDRDNDGGMTLVNDCCHTFTNLNYDQEYKCEVRVMLVSNHNNDNSINSTNELQSQSTINYQKAMISKQFAWTTFKTLAKSKINGKWSEPCCDKICVIKDYEIKYCDPRNTPLRHKMSFGDRMGTAYNYGIFEMEILIINTGDLKESGNFSFGVTVAEGNKYFNCGSMATFGVSNHRGYGCNFHIDLAPPCETIIKGGRCIEGPPLTNGSTAICRLDLIKNKLLFKFNNGEFIDSKFSGFDQTKQAIGYYFVYTPCSNNCHIRVLRCEKIQ